MSSTSNARECTIAASLQIIGERWTLLAVREMIYDVNRFDQIAANTGAARNILADRLRTLETEGIVERRQYSERPPRFEYHLTEAGLELAPVLLALRQWGEKWTDARSATTFEHVCGHELQVDYVCRACQHVVTTDSVQLTEATN